MEREKYQCCFCGKKIIPSQTDITSLLVISNWEKSKDFQREQQLFCHIKCLTEKLDAQTPLYIADY
jgi:hypothetical protein